MARHLGTASLIKAGRRSDRPHDTNVSDDRLDHRWSRVGIHRSRPSLWSSHTNTASFPRGERTRRVSARPLRPGIWRASRTPRRARRIIIRQRRASPIVPRFCRRRCSAPSPSPRKRAKDQAPRSRPCRDTAPASALVTAPYRSRSRGARPGPAPGSRGCAVAHRLLARMAARDSSTRPARQGPPRPPLMRWSHRHRHVDLLLGSLRAIHALVRRRRIGCRRPIGMERPWASPTTSAPQPAGHRALTAQRRILGPRFSGDSTLLSPRRETHRAVPHIPMMCRRDADPPALVASASVPPTSGLVPNLVANPQVVVEHGPDRYDAVARAAEEEDSITCAAEPLKTHPFFADRRVQVAADPAGAAPTDFLNVRDPRRIQAAPYPLLVSRSGLRPFSGFSSPPRRGGEISAGDEVLGLGVVADDGRGGLLGVVLEVLARPRRRCGRPRAARPP